jgi:hypothetical protein
MNLYWKNLQNNYKINILFNIIING